MDCAVTFVSHWIFTKTRFQISARVPVVMAAVLVILLVPL